MSRKELREIMRQWRELGQIDQLIIKGVMSEAERKEPKGVKLVRVRYIEAPDTPVMELCNALQISQRTLYDWEGRGLDAIRSGI